MTKIKPCPLGGRWGHHYLKGVCVLCGAEEIKVNIKGGKL